MVSSIRRTENPFPMLCNQEEGGQFMHYSRYASHQLEANHNAQHFQTSQLPACPLPALVKKAMEHLLIVTGAS
jgi:hypothetical protein